MTDVGMTGSRSGIIGVKREQALEAFRTQMPIRFETATEDIWVMGAALDIGDDGLARSITQVLYEVPTRPLHAQLVPRQQRHQQERQEPGDVEVEPVLDRQQDGDHHRRSERGDRDRAARPRAGTRRGSRGRAANALTIVWSGPRSAWPQTLKGESRPAWFPMVLVPEGRQARVEQGLGHDDGRGGGEGPDERAPDTEHTPNGACHGGASHIRRQGAGCGTLRRATRSVSGGHRS